MIDSNNKTIFRKFVLLPDRITDSHNILHECTHQIAHPCLVLPVNAKTLLLPIDLRLILWIIPLHRGVPIIMRLHLKNTGQFKALKSNIFVQVPNQGTFYAPVIRTSNESQRKHWEQNNDLQSFYISEEKILLAGSVQWNNLSQLIALNSP